MRPASFLLTAAVAVTSVTAAIIPKHARRCVVTCFAVTGATFLIFAAQSRCVQRTRRAMQSELW